MSEPRLRLKSCVENWPDCEEGSYNPYCCRFPKSCSCTVYDDDRVTPDDLEGRCCDLPSRMHPEGCTQEPA